MEKMKRRHVNDVHITSLLMYPACIFQSTDFMLHTTTNYLQGHLKYGGSNLGDVLSERS